MNSKRITNVGYGLLLLGLVAAPFVGAYPVFVMKLMCFALFACAFNMLLGYTGLLYFGHAAFFGFGDLTLDVNQSTTNLMVACLPWGVRTMSPR